MKTACSSADSEWSDLDHPGALGSPWSTLAHPGSLGLTRLTRLTRLTLEIWDRLVEQRRQSCEYARPGYSEAGQLRPRLQRLGEALTLRTSSAPSTNSDLRKL